MKVYLSKYLKIQKSRHLYHLDMEDKEDHDMEPKQDEQNIGYGNVNDVLSDKCRDQVNHIILKDLILLRNVLC